VAPQNDPSLASRRLSRDDANAKESKSQQSTGTSIVGLDVDSVPFFYPTESGGVTGESLLVVTTNGNLIRVHINAPQDTPPSLVLPTLSQMF
jgi:hypothetical protein